MMLLGKFLLSQQLVHFTNLKALCHATMADCLLIEAVCTHSVNKQWAGGWPISLRARSNLLAEAHFAGCSTSQA